MERGTGDREKMIFFGSVIVWAVCLLGILCHFTAPVFQAKCSRCVNQAFKLWRHAPGVAALGSQAPREIILAKCFNAFSSSFSSAPGNVQFPKLLWEPGDGNPWMGISPKQLRGVWRIGSFQYFFVLACRRHMRCTCSAKSIPKSKCVFAHTWALRCPTCPHFRRHLVTIQSKTKLHPGHHPSKQRCALNHVTMTKLLVVNVCSQWSGISNLHFNHWLLARNFFKEFLSRHPMEMSKVGED